MSFSITAGTERSRFTRMCIGEAILKLLQTLELDQLKISMISNTAGVSRLTFYHYYRSPADALNDYLNEIIFEYLHACKERPSLAFFMDYDHVLFALKFFDRYSFYFQTIIKRGLHALLFNGVTRLMNSHAAPALKKSPYSISYYAGGLLTVFLNWQISPEKEPPEAVARAILDLQSPSGKTQPAT